MNTDNHPATVREMIQFTRDKNEQQLEYINKLERCIAIQSLVPKAFEHGPVVSTLKPNGEGYLRFEIKTGDGAFQWFALNETPVVLWKDQYLKEYYKLKHYKYANLIKEYDEQRESNSN